MEADVGEARRASRFPQLACASVVIAAAETRQSPLVHGLAVDDQARNLLLSADANEVVLIAGLHGVADVHVDLVLIHEAQDLLAIRAGLLHVEGMVLDVRQNVLLRNMSMELGTN